MANPTPPELQHLVRSTYAALMRRQGGVRRRGQQEMIGAIAGAVANAKKIGQDGSGARMLAINAPTGCGKSFAYGVGAIPVALANDLRVVISTSNVALQVQLIERDLVALAAVIPGMHTALVKGRSRLACGVKMRRAIEEGKDGTGEVAVMLHSLRSGTWNGDVDALQEQPAASTWKLCTNDRAGCAGRKCGSVNECPYYRSRAAIDSANVLVTNHDMLLADARAGFVVLPKPENCVYILDEAHELPQKAIASLAGGHALEDAEAVALQASRMVGEVRRLAKGGPLAALAETAGASVELMAGALNEAKMAIAESARTTEVRDESRPVRFRGGLLPQWLGRAASECHRAAEASSVALLALMQALAGDEGDMLHERVRERLLADVGSAATRVEGIALVWKLMSSPRTAEGPVAKWIEVSPETRDLRVCASPIGVGEYLHETIWSKAAAAIHLSGTLTTVGGMDPYLKASGLALTPGGIRTLGVQSPFDHAKQAKLIVPRMVSPKDAEEHTKWLAANLPNMIRENGEGMPFLNSFFGILPFCLFSHSLKLIHRELIVCSLSID